MKFALVGVGYVSSKHLEAIKSCNGDLIAVCDPYDSVGILDKYFPNTEYFGDTNEFEIYLRSNLPDYLVICSPNFTHINYLKMADRLGIASICEKPIVIQPSELELFTDTNAILQLRYANNIGDIHPVGDNVYVEYYTPRGKWYHKSWKNKENLSGGLLTNIGIHLFDLMIHSFGEASNPKLYKLTNEYAEGSFNAGYIKINWRLSIEQGLSHRLINGVALEVEGLHSKAYQAILEGKGIKKIEASKSLELINEYRSISKNLG